MKSATAVCRVVLLIIGVFMTLAVAVGGSDIQLAASTTAPADYGQRQFAIRAVDTSLGVATCQFAHAGVGTHSITVVYSGTAEF